MIDFGRELPIRAITDAGYVPELVERILHVARRYGTSDVHLIPTADGLQMDWRIDGVLQPVHVFPAELSPKVIARLKVLSQLLTYQTDMPQEGRIREQNGEGEKRVSVFPTLFGEKAVVRLFAGIGQFQKLGDLRLPEDVLSGLRRSLDQTAGLILLTGPAGSGKTTTIYACLREMSDKSTSGRSLVSLEDPIETVVPGVSQSQVSTAAGFTLEVGLRSLVRQDPDVIMVGEIRDRAVAEIVFQASLTGHLVLTTFHAGSAAGAISRLSDMGIEPYLLRSGVSTIVCQRLLRRLCVCAQPGTDDDRRLGLRVNAWREPVGCPQCSGSGYVGRIVVAEILQPDRTDIGRAILSRTDTAHLESMAVEAGMVTRWQRALVAVEKGETSPEEVRRVLGWDK